MPANPRPNEKLVKVFEAREESEAMVVRGLLESSGLEAVATSPEAPQDILPGVGNTIVLVREESAAEARAIIAAYRNRGVPRGADEASEAE